MRRRILLVIAVVGVLLLFRRCACAPPAVNSTPAGTRAANASAPDSNAPGASGAAAEERLTPATVRAPERVLAGAPVTVEWTGPDNAGDFLAFARAAEPQSAPDARLSYQATSQGSVLTLTAPLEPGAYELAYVAARSRTILGRTSIAVDAATATLDAADEVVLGAPLAVHWSGPGNAGDFITLVMQGTPDAQHGNYTETSKGTPLSVLAPTTVGEAELRYIAAPGGGERKVLARRPVRIVAAEVTLAAPESAVAGATIPVEWTGPNNAGDYITVVAPDARDDVYGNYTNTEQGSPLALLMPIAPGRVELRYVAAQGRRVLARRAIELSAPEVTLTAPTEAPAGADVTIEWSGPNYSGDYITIVPAGTPDGRYAKYQNTSAGSPVRVAAPATSGAAEVRYMSGQGAQVLARRAIEIRP